VKIESGTSGSVTMDSWPLDHRGGPAALPSTAKLDNLSIYSSLNYPHVLCEVKDMLFELQRWQAVYKAGFVWGRACTRARYVCSLIPLVSPRDRHKSQTLQLAILKHTSHCEVMNVSLPLLASYQHAHIYRRINVPICARALQHCIYCECDCQTESQLPCSRWLLSTKGDETLIRREYLTFILRF
jgi:hypothetical protein